jgi:hypothetical protein
MGFDVAFDAQWFAKHWWLLFPILGFAVAFYSMYLDHRRKRGWMDLMRTYAEQGKEPPANLTNAATSGDWHWNGPPAYHGRSRFWDVRRAIFLGVLAGAFALLHYYGSMNTRGFGIAAIVLGALAAGFLLMALIPRPRSDAPPKTNGT